MASALVTFSQVVAKAQEVDAALEEDHDGIATGRRPLSRPAPVDATYVAPSDRDLAVHVTRAIAELQDAMDAAIKSGLIVDPEFKTVSGRFNEFGVSVDSHIVNVQVYRKLV